MLRFALLALMTASPMLTACAGGDDDPTLEVAASRAGLCYREAYVRCWNLYPSGFDDPKGRSCFDGADLAYWEGPDSGSLCQYSEDRGVCGKSWTFTAVCSYG